MIMKCYLKKKTTLNLLLSGHKYCPYLKIMLSLLKRLALFCWNRMRLQPHGHRIYSDDLLSSGRWYRDSNLLLVRLRLYLLFQLHDVTPYIFTDHRIQERNTIVSIYHPLDKEFKSKDNNMPFYLNIYLNML